MLSKCSLALATEIAIPGQRLQRTSSRAEAHRETGAVVTAAVSLVWSIACGCCSEHSFPEKTRRAAVDDGRRRRRGGGWCVSRL